MRKLHAWKFIDPYRDVVRELHADSDRKIIWSALRIKGKVQRWPYVVFRGESDREYQSALDRKTSQLFNISGVPWL